VSGKPTISSKLMSVGPAAVLPLTPARGSRCGDRASRVAVIVAEICATLCIASSRSIWLMDWSWPISMGPAPRTSGYGTACLARAEAVTGTCLAGSSAPGMDMGRRRPSTFSAVKVE